MKLLPMIVEDEIGENFLLAIFLHNIRYLIVSTWSEVAVHSLWIGEGLVSASEYP